MASSKIYKLGKEQPELDFVDIDPKHDTPLFIDPYFLANRNDRWSMESTRTIRSFFGKLLELLKADSVDEARCLFSYLVEPNETCLGLSKAKPRGHGVGETDTSNIFESLLKSKAVKSGIVEDIQDCHLFVDNFAKDKLSDMATNIIRKHLIDYTQHQCKLWNIPLTPSIASGSIWDRVSQSWITDYYDMLVINGKKILLVPKGIVSFCSDYIPSKYYQHYVLNFLQSEHLRLNTALVKFRYRKGVLTKKYVTKKSISESEAPFSKEFLRQFTEKHPQVFKQFKLKAKANVESLTHSDLQCDVQTVIAELITKLENTPAGNANASVYHRTVLGILELIFYPSLICPQLEQEIHDGRKRIDITFDNAASEGFFFDIHMVHKIPSQYIFVECKNYSEDPTNPELDQLSGRFSPNRGKFGLLVCREVDDLPLFLKRCTDTYKDDRGLIVPVTDSDLILILKSMQGGNWHSEDNILRDRVRSIILT